MLASTNPNKVRFRNKGFKGEYVPPEIQKEFDIPDNLEEHTINYDNVLRADNSRKRKTPLWSGQDILEIGLTNELSSWIVAKINKVRVWPKGWFGYFKKARCALKYLVKHSLFDSAMTLCVLLNTIVMGMEHYNMDE